MSQDAKHKLVDFLDHRAFDPVLKRRADDVSEKERGHLADVQRATRSERERFHHYGSAEEVVRMFKDDLDSEPAKKIHRELQRLGLPTLNDLRDDFLGLAKQLGVER
jgi:hypothetical protein